MTDDQMQRLLSLADRMQRAMPVNGLVIELHGLLREIIRGKGAAAAPAPKPAARAKPSTREVVEGAIERSKTRKGRAVKQRA
jgi:hypothetical protein